MTESPERCLFCERPRGTNANAKTCGAPECRKKNANYSRVECRKAKTAQKRAKLKAMEYPAIRKPEPREVPALPRLAYLAPPRQGWETAVDEAKAKLPEVIGRYR